MDSPELSDRAREVFQNTENEVFLSSVSTWEIAVKHRLGKLPLPESPQKYIPLLRRRHGIESLSLDEESSLQLTRLPHLHRDPFDRMLICQSIIGGLAILTPDQAIVQYPVHCVW
jgi:PIN domain nuclease of toxin-antitoxin system